MTAINFNTTNQTYRQLLANGLSYQVPRFQRDFSWTPDHWDDLWQDIQETLRPGGEPAHYMGYLVLQTRDNKAFDVIDGQQRLTTLSLLILSVIKVIGELAEKNVESENNRRRIEQLRGSYIGYLDPVTLIPKSKLSLNRNNDAYYKDYLIPLQKLPQRGLRASEHLLRKCFEWFTRRVREEYGERQDGAALAGFIEDLSDRLFFTVITVTDELNAFKVFETLNARGVRLSPTDLLKNYLFSVVHGEGSHPQEIETLERRWEAMVGRLGGESFPDFLRTHWNSRRPFVREADLFKTIRAETPGKFEVFDLIRQMEEDLDVYAALPNPEDNYWTRPDHKQHVRELRMFSVRQAWPLLLASRRVFDDDGFGGILRACSVISFRYNVISGLATNEQERTYNRVAQKIASSEFTQHGDVIRALASIYVSDDAFRSAFSEKILRTTSARNRHVARYLLFSLEKHIAARELDMDSPLYTLEHVLPESVEDQWPQFDDRQAEEFVYRLGNFALLEADDNRSAGNLAFSRKKNFYAGSCFETTRLIAKENEDWNAERIAERQRWMAKQATGLWRISQLS